MRAPIGWVIIGHPLTLATQCGQYFFVKYTLGEHGFFGKKMFAKKNDVAISKSDHLYSPFGMIVE